MWCPNILLTPRATHIRMARAEDIVGERSISKNLPTITQDLSRRSIARSAESVSMHPRRPKAEALSNAVDVVERLRDPIDQVPNTRHLRDLHTFSSVKSLEL